MHKMKQNKGFTLIELSIVIVIIGLIVAGVVGGQALVEQAKLRQLSAFNSKLKVAINTFKLEYGQIPGDITNAFDFFGSALGCTNNLATQNNSGCNGDGDKYIESTIAANRKESDRAWMQLGHVGLLEGSYTGNYGAGGYSCTPGINVPKITTINGQEIGASFWGNSNGDKLINVSAEFTINNCHTVVFSVKQVSNIDNKIDDGIPNEGTIRLQNNPICFDGNSYNLDDTSSRCSYNIVNIY